MELKGIKMEVQNTQQANINKDFFSPMLLAFLKQKIKELGQEKNEQIIMESIQVVADEITHKQAINTKEIKDELEERLKGELATKDFVRAEIAEVKQELKLEIASVRTEIAEVKSDIIKWLIGLQIALGGFIVAILKLF